MIEPTAEQPIEAELNPTPVEARYAKERDAFIRYTQDQGEQIPENFADAGAWFDSLKNAQSQYTKGQQEIANLKKQYNENGVTNPNFNPEGSTESEATEESTSVPEDVENLQISSPNEEIEEALEETPTIEAPPEVTQGEWNDWGSIIDASGGEVPESLRNTIKMRLNVDDAIIDDYMTQRKVIQQQNVSSAADLVGGKAELNDIMDWARTNLNDDERLAVNSQLAGPGYKTAILGLKARYETSDSVSAARGREPSATPNRVTNANAVQGVTPYASNEEMFADQRNPVGHPA